MANNNLSACSEDSTSSYQCQVHTLGPDAEEDKYQQDFTIVQTVFSQPNKTRTFYGNEVQLQSVTGQNNRSILTFSFFNQCQFGGKRMCNNVYY